MTADLFHVLVKIWIGIGIIMFPVLLSISAPYGRHNRPGWGPVIPNRLGWVVMELPSLCIFILAFVTGPVSINAVTTIFFLLWVIHYTHRSLIWPFRTHTSKKMMPLLIVLLAIFFNLVNGFINGYYFGFISEGYPPEWIYESKFIVGSIFFFSGMAINLYSDQILLSLRKKSQNGYSVPEGGLFRLISCPNFFGEIMEWAGFAIMTWSPAALAFAIWTAVNLIPRALDHHKWYINKFENYPSGRKAIFPFIL